MPVAFGGWSGGARPGIVQGHWAAQEVVDPCRLLWISSLLSIPSSSVDPRLLLSISVLSGRSPSS